MIGATLSTIPNEKGVKVGEKDICRRSAPWTLARQAAWHWFPSRMPATLPKLNSLDASTPAAAHRGTLSSWEWLLWDQHYKKRASTDVCQNQDKRNSHEAPYLCYVEGKRYLIFFYFFFSPVDLVEGNQDWWTETVCKNSAFRVRHMSVHLKPVHDARSFRQGFFEQTAFISLSLACSLPLCLVSYRVDTKALTLCSQE